MSQGFARPSHPTAPILVVEVALASIALDRGEKASLYARAGVADYWIVNLVDTVLEVYRAPVTDPHAVHGGRYPSTATLRDRDAFMRGLQMAHNVVDETIQ